MIRVYETRDVTLLRELLETDRAGGAYLLGDLDAPFFDKGTWFVATLPAGSTACAGGTRALAIVLVFEAFSVPTVLSFGDRGGVDAIVRSAALPSDCYLKIPPEHEAAFAAAFDIRERDVMKVLALDRCDYRSSLDRHEVRRLDVTFPIDQILDVYKSYPGHFFEPGQLAGGVYFGSFERERLVAVAGTHVYSPSGRVAAAGNIVTASNARGRGHGAACTSAVIEELYARGCDTIVLHVAAANSPAQACYRRLGFHEHGPILQRRGQRRVA
jgi:ribosomal protein S18 acetylase RimI-like enzyme